MISDQAILWMREDSVCGYGDHGKPITLGQLRGELDKLKAENAALRARAVDYTIVTDDPSTLPAPPPNDKLILCLCAEDESGYGIVITRSKAKADYWLEPGDCWTYIPKVPI